MRCEECLPLIEEYFDGEATQTTAARVEGHLAACRDCAAALEALSFEAETFARYDRGGLEVSPDLWSRVSAEIAREPLPAPAPERRPFLSRPRLGLAGLLGALAARPAYASSLALLLVGVTAGSLWLSRRPGPAAPSHETAGLKRAAEADATPTPVLIPPSIAQGPAGAGPSAVNPVSSVVDSDSMTVEAGGAAPAAREQAPAAARQASTGGAGRIETVEIAQVSAADDELMKLLAGPPPPPLAAEPADAPHTPGRAGRSRRRPRRPPRRPGPKPRR